MRLECGCATPEQLRADGPSVEVDIHAPDGELLRTVTALLDTGSGVTVININLATELKLPEGERHVTEAIGGKHEGTLFGAWVVHQGIDVGLRGQFLGVRMEPPLILGRDFLSACRMDYDGATGRVSLRRSSSASRERQPVAGTAPSSIG